MHDPHVVAFEILRPWPRVRKPAKPMWTNRFFWRRRADGSWMFSPFCQVGRFELYLPPLVVVWHVEPGGRDSLTVCRRSITDDEGKFIRYTGLWRWHVHHWHFQFPPLQMLRRRLLTRCAWCGARHRRGDPVHFSVGNRDKTPWWRGEAGLTHEDCSSVQRAHDRCFCAQPVLSHGNYGKCSTCRRFRPFGYAQPAADQLLASLPTGARIPAEMRPDLERMWAARATENA